MDKEKEKKVASKSKHYTPAERNLCLQILNKYKEVIECKKSNINTLREKEIAWSNICDEFNNSALITQERSLQQLKKLWTNIKQTQRDIITKEKQNRFATGGGPEIPSLEFDPEVALISPNLMATAPALFSSNMNDNELENQRQMVQDLSSEGNIVVDFETILENNKTTSCETNVPTFKDIISDVTIEIDKTVKKRKLIEKTEDKVKIKRIKNIMEQEQQLAEAKLKHEETMAAIKETHIKEINKLELRTFSAKAELAELILKKEKDDV